MIILVLLYSIWAQQPAYHFYIAKLSFNFNINLVESWDSIIISSTSPAIQPEKYAKEQ